MILNNIHYFLNYDFPDLAIKLSLLVFSMYLLTCSAYDLHLKCISKSQSVSVISVGFLRQLSYKTYRLQVVKCFETLQHLNPKFGHFIFNGVAVIL